MRRLRRAASLALALDVALVVAFAALGRRSHDEGAGAEAVLEVAAPFLVAVLAGWAAARGWRAPLAPVTGIVVGLVTVAGGLALRGVATDRGVAPAFVVVTVVVLGGAIAGWRLAAARLAHRTHVR